MLTIVAWFGMMTAAAMPGADAAWESLQSGPIVIECTEVSGAPWCRSSGVVGAPVEKLSATLEDMASSDKVFDDVSEINVLEEGVLHVVLDFPGMLSDRDYVSKYTRSTDGEVKKYAWVPVVHPGAPQRSGVVRLVDMAGEWQLKKEGAGTRVTYIWQADLSGSFPSWAYSIARKKTGNQVITDLAKSHGAQVLK